MKEQFVSVGLLPVLNMPPADKTAVFPLKEQLVSVGLLPLLYIPPPWLAEFPLNVQLVTVGLLKEVNIPPPWTVLPPVITKPLRTVAGPSPLTQVTPLPEPPALMIVFITTPASFGSVLRTVIALPLTLMFSKYSP